MWTEAYAARKKAASAGSVKPVEVLSRPITHGSDARNRSAEYYAKPKSAQLAQVGAMLEAHRARVEAARERHASTPVVEVPALVPGKLGRPIGSKSFPQEYPSCPRCQANEIKRAGVSRGQQRFRCLACKRSFGGNMRIVVAPEVFHITCFRCGAAGKYVSKRHMRRSTQGGIVGHCAHCGKNFLQGGPEHLERTMVLLLKRVDEFICADKVKAELLQIACLDVLEGKAYTWNVPLNVSRAKANTRDTAYGPSIEYR